MADAPRFLIGYGERLTEPIRHPPGGGGAPSPYSSSDARARLAPQVARAASAARRLPTAACPDDRVVSVMTLHPQFVAKSHYPGQLLRAAGFEQVGSRPRQIVPERVTRQVTIDKERTFESIPGE